MLQLQEHNYLVVIMYLVFIIFFEGGHFENGPYNIVHPNK